VGQFSIGDPDQFCIGDYNRGCGVGRWVRRMSWTRDLKTAIWFAQYRARLGSGITAVYGGIVRSCGVLGMFDARDDGAEPEVVVDPRFLTNVRRMLTLEECSLIMKARARGPVGR
jgi:hypothetical protein